ncbi:MFS transporter [Aestuariivirga litoralis]|uniref:MFS transporter n=1 Tax=Aestuariivirga litoralis TaxID=2650924 RepID=UPI0018C6FA7D|nr:MFS transporter [Aestuariivirga litoralis]
MTARHFGLRFSLAYALMMTGSGIQLPFLPLWLQAQGLSLAQISAVVAAMTAMRVIGAPLFAAIADMTGRRFLVIRSCAIAAVLAYGTLSQMQGYPMIMGVALAAALFFAPVFPLVEGFSVDTASRVGLDYGRLRLWASLSFLAGSLISGALLTVLSAKDTMMLITAAQMLTVVATLLLPPEPPKPAHHLDVAAMQFGPALRFLFASRFTVFLVAASLSNSSHGMLYSVSSVYWDSLGFSSFGIGALWAFGIFTEVTLFFLSKRLITHLPVQHLLCIGLLGATVRWVGMAYATNYYLIAALMAFHGISFATAHLSLMHFIRLNVPSNLRNTAQGLYTAFASGLLLSGVTWASGPLYARYGGEAFLFTAAIALVGLVVALFNLVWLSPTERLQGLASHPSRS